MSAASGGPPAAGDPAAQARRLIQPLLRVRQVREFTAEPVAAAELEALADAARWSGSSQNEQPWRFVLVRDPETLRRIAEAGTPQTRPLESAAAAIAIALPVEPSRAVSRAYDEGRAAERILAAAALLGLGAGITWIRSDVLARVRAALALPEDWMVRTIVAVGHPTEVARRPKSPPGQARRHRSEAVFRERWPSR